MTDIDPSSRPPEGTRSERFHLVPTGDPTTAVLALLPACKARLSAGTDQCFRLDAVLALAVCDVLPSVAAFAPHAPLKNDGDDERVAVPLMTTKELRQLRRQQAENPIDIAAGRECEEISLELAAAFDALIAAGVPAGPLRGLVELFDRLGAGLASESIKQRRLHTRAADRMLGALSGTFHLPTGVAMTLVADGWPPIKALAAQRVLA